MTDEGRRSDSKAPFNMAIDTLERLGDILRDIKRIDQDIMLNFEQKQALKVASVQHFFMNATPLLEQEDKDKFEEQVLSLKPKQLRIMTNSFGNATVFKGTSFGYDPELDRTLNKLLIDIQTALQDGKFFMPPRKDLSRSITEM